MIRISTTNPADTSRTAPPWLSGADRAADDNLYLRLMIVNPLNGEVCPMLETSIEPDPYPYAPSAADLHIGTL